MKNKKRNFQIFLAQLGLIWIIVAGIMFITTAYAIEIPVAEITTIAAEEPELSVREYVFTEVENALGFDEAIYTVGIIQCESGWRDDIVIIEPNGSISLGLWQINTVHNNEKSKHYISNVDKLDYKLATQWTITKRISDGNWSAWSCAK